MQRLWVNLEKKEFGGKEKYIVQCCPQADSLPRPLCPHSLPDQSDEQGEVIPV